MLVMLLQAGPALKRQSSGDSGGLGHPHPSLSRGASLDSPKVTCNILLSVLSPWLVFQGIAYYLLPIAYCILHIAYCILHIAYWYCRADTAAEVLLTRRAAVRFFPHQSQHPGRCLESRFPGSGFPGSGSPEYGFPGSRYLGSCSPEPSRMPWIQKPESTISISLLDELDFFIQGVLV